MKMIQVKIDVSKINKEKLYKGEKGTYLDAVIFLNDEADSYGNWGAVQQSTKKDEKSIYIGNVKMKERLYSVTELKELVKEDPAPTTNYTEPLDDLPF